MHIERLSLIDGARQARGLAVIIDVFRAFSVAAYAFERGASEIILVGDVAQAFALKEEFPDALLMGEVGGQPIPGFDFGNSPTEITQADLRGRRLVQRTSAGTQGVVSARDADEVVLGNFVCAQATVEYIWRRKPVVVSLVAMGETAQDRAEEDEACAELLGARLRGERIDEVALMSRLRRTEIVEQFIAEHPGTPLSDMEYSLRLDCFDFVMPVGRVGGLLVAKKVGFTH